MQSITLRHYLEHLPDDPLGERIDSFEQLLARLDELWRSHVPFRDERIGVRLTHPNGSVLTVGFGDGAWLLFFDGEPFGPSVAVGNRNATGTTRFALPEWSEVKNKYVLTTPIAHEAIGYWMTHGEPARFVGWA